MQSGISKECIHSKKIFFLNVILPLIVFLLFQLDGQTYAKKIHTFLVSFFSNCSIFVKLIKWYNVNFRMLEVIRASVTR